MVKKVFTFRGKTMAELQKMDNKEFSALLNSRAKRSLLRGANKELDKKVKEALESGNKDRVIRTHRRDSIITPKMAGLKLGTVLARP